MSSYHLDEEGAPPHEDHAGPVGAVSDHRFDRIVRLARRVAGADAAVLAIRGAGRVVFRSATGIDLTEVQGPAALFQETFSDRGIVSVDDAAANPRYASDALVRREAGFRFFVGRSLVEPAGNRVAVLAALAREPRHLDPDQARLFNDVAALAERELGRSALDSLLIEYRQGSAWAQAVMDNVTEALVTIGSDGRILSVNRSADRMFGRADLVGLEMGEIIAPEDREVIDRSVRLALASSGDSMRITHKCHGVTAAGRRFPVEISLGGTWLTGEETVLVAVVHDVTDREATESALRSSELRHTATFDQSPMGIALVSLEGRLIEANTALADFLERSVEGLVELTFREFTHPDDVGPTEANYRQLSERTIDRFSMEKRYVTPSGEVKWGNLTVSAVFQSDGRVEYFVAMVEDINDRKRAEGQLVEALENQQQAIEDLDRASKAKSYFVSLVGHEFRTALTGIQGFSELLSEHEFGPAEVKEFASEIHREGLRLTRMISEMLDLDRMESGRMKLNVSTVDLNALVEDVVERFRATTDLHQIETVTGPGLDAVEADGDKLTQVVSNLVSNAIKYSPRGGAIVIRTAADAGDAVVAVRDEGLGVPVEALETIFQRYARHESKDRELIKGTGLGLPVVRQIVEMHGGRVWAANNEPERGATFTFRIPRARVEE